MKGPFVGEHDRGANSEPTTCSACGAYNRLAQCETAAPRGRAYVLDAWAAVVSENPVTTCPIISDAEPVSRRQSTRYDDKDGPH